MNQRDPNWLREILDDAAEKVKDKPDWLRSPELRAELRRLEERHEARAKNAPPGSRGSQSSTRFIAEPAQPGLQLREQWPSGPDS